MKKLITKRTIGKVAKCLSDTEKWLLSQEYWEMCRIDHADHDNIEGPVIAAMLAICDFAEENGVDNDHMLRLLALRFWASSQHQDFYRGLRDFGMKAEKPRKLP